MDDGDQDIESATERADRLGWTEANRKRATWWIDVEMLEELAYTVGVASEVRKTAVLRPLYPRAARAGDTVEVRVSGRNIR